MYDSKDLRNALTDYFGTAMCCGNPAAVLELTQVQQASDRELRCIAEQNGFDFTTKE